MKMHNKIRQVLATGLLLMISPIASLHGSSLCQLDIENGTNGLYLNIMDSQGEYLVEHLSPGKTHLIVLDEKPEFISFSLCSKDVSVHYDIHSDPDNKIFNIFLDDIATTKSYLNLKAKESFYGTMEDEHPYFVKVSGESIIHKGQVDEPHRYKIEIKGGKMKQDL